jgi:hypothetical protein
MDLDALPLDGEVASDGKVEKAENLDYLTRPCLAMGWPTPSNLATYRWYLPRLTPTEELRLVRYAKIGNREARPGW